MRDARYMIEEVRSQARGDGQGDVVAYVAQADAMNRVYQPELSWHVDS